MSEKAAVHGKPLTAGLSLIYSSYLGGSGIDRAWAVDVNPTREAYAIGRTSSKDFPLVLPFQATHGGLFDAFLVKVADSPEDVKRGDINFDGAIDLLDVRLCHQIASGHLGGTVPQRSAADMDYDGEVDMEDYVILADYVLGRRLTFP